jgi:hypothetical protein
MFGHTLAPIESCKPDQCFIDREYVLALAAASPEIGNGRGSLLRVLAFRCASPACVVDQQAARGAGGNRQ